MCFKGAFEALAQIKEFTNPAHPTLADKKLAQAWVFAHIQLTPEEVAKYKNIPVVYDGEYGFFFEPNE